MQNISPATESFVYIRQAEPLGLGHAVLCAESVVGNEPFAVILADDLIDAGRTVIGQLCDARAALGGGSVLAVEDVPRADTRRYGIVSSSAIDASDCRACRTSSRSRRPRMRLPRLAVLGRYVLEPEIFEHLKRIPRGAGGEIQLTDAIARLVPRGRTYAYRYDGRRFDCGSKEGFLEATVHFARKAGYAI